MKRATMIYDGECRFCSSSEKLLRRFVGWRLKTLPLQNPDAMKLHPDLSPEKAQSRLHLVVPHAGGDKLYGGMEAVAQTLALRPVGKIALMYYVPPLRRALDALYMWIARNRYKLFGRTVGGCEEGACSINRQDAKSAKK